MKRIYLLRLLPIAMFCLLFQRSAAQSEHIIQGKILGAGGKKIFLVEDMFYQTNNAVDSVVAAADGSFTFKKMLSEPTIYVLGVKGGPRENNSFVVDGPMTMINGRADSIAKLNISGSKEDVLFKRVLNGFNAQKTMNDFGKAINDAIAAKNLSEANRINEMKMNWMFTALKDSLTNFIANNSGTLVSAICLAKIKGSLSTNDFQRYLDMVKLGSKSPSIIAYLQQPEQSIGPKEGDMAADFSQPDLNGKPVKLSSYKGKYVLVDFWASWCKNCRLEHPDLIKAYTKFKDKGFTILSISFDTSKENWKKAIADDGLLWKNLSDLTGMDNSYVAKLYQIQGLPVNYLIDTQGRIIAKNLRGTDLAEKLGEIFQKKP